MRLIKRLLVLASELGAAMVGFVLTSLLTAAAGFVSGYDPILGSIVFLAGLIATTVGFFALRRIHRPWKIEFDAAAWTLARAERRLHPTRAACKRIATRIFVWAPSLIAAAVLLFYPAVTHLIYHRSRHLGPYRVTIPWTVAVLLAYDHPPRFGSTICAAAATRWSFGLMPFWKMQPLSSGMSFSGGISEGSVGAGTPEDWTRTMEERYAANDKLLRREFRLDGDVLTCWQFLQHNPEYWTSGPDPVWRIECKMPPGPGGRSFDAWFYGRSKDIPLFYKIIASVTPVK